MSEELYCGFCGGEVDKHNHGYPTCCGRGTQSYILSLCKDLDQKDKRIAELEKEKESWRVKCIKYDMRVGDLELRLDKAEGYGRYAKDFKEHPTVIKEASDE